MVPLDDSTYNIGDIQEAAAACTAGQAGKQEHHQLFVRAYRQGFDFLINCLHYLVNLREQKQASRLTDTGCTVHTVGNTELW
ncbi:hypothetical protein D3C73_1236670 [compost metagenome]